MRIEIFQILKHLFRKVIAYRFISEMCYLIRKEKKLKEKKFLRRKNIF